MDIYYSYKYENGITTLFQVLHNGLDGIQDALASSRNPVVNLPTSFGTSCKSARKSLTYEISFAQLEMPLEVKFWAI